MKSMTWWLLLWSTVAASQTLKINCDKGDTIAAAIQQMKPGDALLVEGICRENVVFAVESARLTIDGQGTAKIIGAVSTSAPVTILGRGIVVRGFTISGGRNGINILRGGTATIDSNVIRKTGGAAQPGSGSGINLAQHSFASIINNTIEENPSGGIVVHENSSARIGFSDVDSPSPRGNMIRNNGAWGIRFMNSATGRLVGNTIEGHTTAGVSVSQGSQATLASNVFNGNSASAIEVRNQSGVELGDEVGVISGRNSSNPGAPKNGVAVQCSTGSYVGGDLGTIAAVEEKRFDKTCLDATRR